MEAQGAAGEGVGGRREEEQERQGAVDGCWCWGCGPRHGGSWVVLGRSLLGLGGGAGGGNARGAAVCRALCSTASFLSSSSSRENSPVSVFSFGFCLPFFFSLLWSQVRCALMLQAGAAHIFPSVAVGVLGCPGCGSGWLWANVAGWGMLKCCGRSSWGSWAAEVFQGFPFVAFMDCFAWALFSGFLAYPNQFFVYNAPILFVFLFIYVSLCLLFVVYNFFKDFKESFFLLFL